MKFKCLLLLLLSLAKISCVFSQYDWHSGYILKSQTDTIFGYIDNKGTKSNTIQCFFKETKDGEIIEYSPNELFGYRFIGGEYYITKNLKVNGVDTPVFYEFLINGIVNVYHVFYKQSRFFLEKSEEIFELKNTKKLEEIDYKKYEIFKKEYIGVLTVLLSDGNIMSQIQSTDFSTNSLINIAKTYHQKVCNGEECIVYKRERVNNDKNFKFSLYGGVSIAKIDFGGHTESDFCTGSQIGLRLEYCNLFLWAKNFSVALDLKLQNFTNGTLREKRKESSSYITYNDQNYLLSTVSSYYNPLNHLKVNLKMTSINIPLVVSYVFYKNEFKPYFGGGIVNNIVIQQNEDFIYQRFYDIYGKSIPVYSNGIILAAGTKFNITSNEFYIELNYEKTKTHDSGKTLQLSTNLYSFKCGYIF